MCQSKKQPINQTEVLNNTPTNHEQHDQADAQTYNVKLFHIRKSLSGPKPKLKSNLDFRVEVVVNNHLAKVIVDTGAS